MAKLKVYINPRDESGNLTSFIEVTDDVDLNSLNKISLLIDNDEFNVGQFEYNDFSIKLRNDHGRYSDITSVKSIFRFRRGGCPIKVTWQKDTIGPICGIAIAGSAVLGSEEEIVSGILNDEDSIIDADTQQISFRILTKDSIFSEVETPFSSMSNGDTYEDSIYLLLNQSEITELLTVDSGNISVGLDIAMDDVSNFENTTVKEGLDKLLFQSNSVLYIKDNTVYVSSRAGGATLIKTFYGYNGAGQEDVVDIKNLSNGKKKLFNYWTWEDTTLSSKNVSSISANGIRKKELKFAEITNTTKRQSILDEQRDEFSELKQSFDLITFLNYENLGVNILDKVMVDVPPIYYSNNVDGTLPLYGSAIYGQDVYPISQFSAEIDSTAEFRVMGKSLDFKKQLITFRLEEK